MTTPIILVWGYEKWGNHVPLLKRVFSNHSQSTRGRGLLWVDVRRHRKVRAKGFTESNVVENFAPDYVWIPEFGNEAVTGESSAMRLHDFNAGLEKMRATVTRATAENKDIILFCSCSHAYAYCHRHLVAYRLHEAEPSWTIKEWAGQDIPRTQRHETKMEAFTERFVYGSSRRHNVPPTA